MKPENNPLCFFLGANTPQGFVSRFDQLADPDDGWRCYVLKGGPGTGKSTLMKKIAASLQKEYDDIELIHCSSDVDSLDCVIVPGLKFAIADGTPPHTIEPKYPGAFETLVDLSVCWDNDLLFGCRDSIISLSRSCSRCHEHCCRFLSAAASLNADTYRLALEAVHTQKLAGYCARLSEKEFKPLKCGSGKEKVRFLSAVTNKGVTSYVDTAKRLCDRIYLINDEFGAVSRLLLHTVRSKALAAGYDIISCYCPLGPGEKLEHLLIPGLRLGFLTSNRFHDFGDSVDPYRIVNSKRFTDNEKLKQHKKRILFNRKAAAQMITQAQTLLRDAKSIHDEMEAYYLNSIDFSKVDQITTEILAQVESMK